MHGKTLTARKQYMVHSIGIIFLFQQFFKKLVSRDQKEDKTQ